jgi:hypothetical protein
MCLSDSGLPPSIVPPPPHPAQHPSHPSPSPCPSLSNAVTTQPSLVNAVNTKLCVLSDSGPPFSFVASLLSFPHLSHTVTTQPSLVDAVNAELERQLSTLSTADTARAAVTKGYAVVAPSLDVALDVCDRLAPEHLEVMVEDSDGAAARLKHYGGLFIGAASAEVGSKQLLCVGVPWVGVVGVGCACVGVVGMPCVPCVLCVRIGCGVCKCVCRVCRVCACVCAVGVCLCTCAVLPRAAVCFGGEGGGGGSEV